MTDTSIDTGWLIDADDALLTPACLDRIADDRLPDRVTWNTFRTLALWNTEAWVPSMLEVACGDGNRLSPLEWDGGKVLPWAAGVAGGDVCEVVLDGPAAYVVVCCTIVPNPPETELRAAAVAALDGSLHGAREAGFVLVTPPGVTDREGLVQRSMELPLHDGRLVSDLLVGAIGYLEWPYLGTLALDLAEENDPQPREQVRRLVAELQARFPGAEM